MKKIFYLIIILNVCSLLTSCSSMNSSFDCPNKAGTMCKSIDQINGMVDSGQIQGRNPDISERQKETFSEFQPYTKMEGYYPGAPLRYGESVQRIWLAPYEDTENNYHQESLMYSIIKGGHWIGSPVKARG